MICSMTEPPLAARQVLQMNCFSIGCLLLEEITEMNLSFKANST